MRFPMGEKNFKNIASNIVGYSNAERAEGQRPKHADDMDVKTPERRSSRMNTTSGINTSRG